MSYLKISAACAALILTTTSLASAAPRFKATYGGPRVTTISYATPLATSTRGVAEDCKSTYCGAKAEKPAKPAAVKVGMDCKGTICGPR